MLNFGATGACFVTKQGPESIHRKIRNLEHRNRRRILKVFYEGVNRITSRDYGPIFDTDFASLVRYDRFSSLLYGSGATCLNIGKNPKFRCSSFAIKKHILNENQSLRCWVEALANETSVVILAKYGGPDLISTMTAYIEKNLFSFYEHSHT